MKKLFVITIGLLIASATAAFAGLTISPSRMEITMRPGDTATGKYTVRNDYDTPADIAVEYRDWFVLPQNEHIRITDWLKVYPSEFRLLPGESRDVEYTVSLPPTADGVLVGMVSFVPSVEIQTGVTLVVSVSLYVAAQGTERVDWSLSDIKVEGRSDALQVMTTVNNAGNVHLRPEGSVVVRKDGRTVTVMNIIEGRPVYPGNSRSVVARSGKGVKLEKGDYTAVIGVTAAGRQKETSVRFTVKKNGSVRIK